MKNLWKGVKKVMKVATDKVVSAVDGFITSKEKLLVTGIMIIGFGCGMVVASQVAFI